MPVGQRRRWHQTLKNRILLENYYLPGDLEQKIADFISHYNHLRYPVGRKALLAALKGMKASPI